jgi:hypothetical protein
MMITSSKYCTRSQRINSAYALGVEVAPRFAPCEYLICSWPTVFCGSDNRVGGRRIGSTESQDVAVVRSG